MNLDGRPDRDLFSANGIATDEEPHFNRDPLSGPPHVTEGARRGGPHHPHLGTAIARRGRAVLLRGTDETHVNQEDPSVI